MIFQAKRSEGAGVLWIVFLAIFSVILVVSIVIPIVPEFVVFILLVVLALLITFTVLHFTTPAYPIQMNSDGRIILSGKDVFLPLEIIDVNYRRARGKGVVYSFGSVTVETVRGTYHFSSVANCKDSANTFKELISKYKYVK